MADERVLILANGEWGDAARLVECVQRADRVIATDGAWAKAVAAGVDVDLVIGDLDSLTAERYAALRESGTEVRAHPPEKDLTDLELAVDSALATPTRNLIVYGAFGGRIDHTLANVLMLEKAVERGVEVELIADGETAWLVRSELTVLAARPGDRISLVPLSDQVVVRTEGLRYPLNDEPLRRTSARGVSNVIDALPVRIAVRSGTLFVVHGRPERPPRGAG